MGGVPADTKTHLGRGVGIKVFASLRQGLMGRGKG